jgi:hypothetical protein
MALTTLNLGYNPVASIAYTHVTDSSADWVSVPVSTYFYDKTDKLPHYKDASGNILEVFTSNPVLQQIQGFQAQEIRRGVQAQASSTLFQAAAGVTASVCGTAGLNNLALGTPATTLIPIPKVRILTTGAAVNAKAGLAWDAASSFPLFYMGKGFRFIGSYVYSDCSSTGLTQYLVPNARQFCGLANATAAANGVDIKAATAVASLTNIIGVGSDSNEANLAVFYNDAGGAATRLDLGTNFPANKTAAVANGEVYTVELYNPCGTSIVYYKVTRLSNNIVATGSVNTNLPDPSAGLTPQIIRTSAADSQNVSIDLCQLMCYTAS